MAGEEGVLQKKQKNTIDTKKTNTMNINSSRKWYYPYVRRFRRKYKIRFDLSFSKWQKIDLVSLTFQIFSTVIPENGSYFLHSTVVFRRRRRSVISMGVGSIGNQTSALFKHSSNYETYWATKKKENSKKWSQNFEYFDQITLAPFSWRISVNNEQVKNLLKKHVNFLFRCSV